MGSGTSSRERSVFQSTELKGIGNLNSVLASDIEMQRLEFTQLVFGLPLSHYFLAMLPSQCFGMVIYMQCHYLLEIHSVVFYFDFIGNYSHEIA